MKKIEIVVSGNAGVQQNAVALIINEALIAANLTNTQVVVAENADACQRLKARRISDMRQDKTEIQISVNSGAKAAPAATTPVAKKSAPAATTPVAKKSAPAATTPVAKKSAPAAKKAAEKTTADVATAAGSNVAVVAKIVGKRYMLVRKSDGLRLKPASSGTEAHVPLADIAGPADARTDARRGLWRTIADVNKGKARCARGAYDVFVADMDDTGKVYASQAKKHG